MGQMENIERLMDRTESELRRLNDELGPKLDEQNQQIQDHGGTLTTLRKEIEGLQENFTEKSAEVENLKQELARYQGLAGAPGLESSVDTRSHGEVFTEADNFLNANDRKNSPSVEVPSFFDGGAGLEKRWLTSNPTGLGGAGNLLQPTRRPELLIDPRRTFIMRDLLNVVPVTGTSVEIVRQTNFWNLYVLVQTANTINTNTITVENVSGLYVGQTIIVGYGAGTPETRTISAINPTTKVITVNANLTVVHAAGETIVSDTLGATQPGALKPETNIEFGVEAITLTTLAHFIPAHRQTLDDMPFLRNMIDTELVYGLALAEEEQLLFGPGTDGNIRGLMNHPGIQNIGTKAGNDSNGNPFTYMDWIRKAMTLSLIAQYPVNGVVLNPNDDEKIEMQKDTTGQYLFINLNPGRQPVVWGVPKVVTISMPAANFLLGSFGLSAELYDREEANIRIAEQHADFFLRNAVVILGEERIGLGVKRPESFVKGKFA